MILPLFFLSTFNINSSTLVSFGLYSWIMVRGSTWRYRTFTKIILIYLIIRSLARPVVQGLHSTGNIKTINIWAIFFGLTPLPIAWIGLHCGLPASYTFYVLLIDGILCNVAEIYVLSRQFKPFSQIIHYKYVYGKSLYISVLSVIPVYIIHSLASSGLGYFFYIIW